MKKRIITLYMLVILTSAFLYAQNPLNYCLNFDGTDDYVETTLDNLSGSEITIEYWFKGSNTQSAVRQQSGGDYIVAGWNDLHILSNEGETVPVGAGAEDGNWHHIAMTWKQNTIDGFVGYLDGNIVGSKNSSNTPISNINVNLILGSYSGTSEFMNGSLDEVRIWNVARTATQIRENMHLTLEGTENGLVSYYQFNEGSGITAADAAGGYNGTLNNMDDTDWVDSTIPIGGGTSHSQNVSSTGSVTFTGTNLSMNFTAKSGTDDFTVTKITQAPNTVPSGVDEVFDDQYWVINQFGSGTFTADLTFEVNENLGSDDEANPNHIRLYKRDTTAEGNWSPVIRASSVDAAGNTATFSDLNACSQFILTRDTDVPDDFPGDALDFDGSDDYVSLPSDISATIGSMITVEAWVWSNTLQQASAVRGIVSEVFGTDGNVEFELFLSGGSHNLFAGFYDGSWHQTYETAAFPMEKWVHVAATYDGHYIRIYRDGTEVAVSSDFNMPLPDGSNGWRIGMRHDAGGDDNMWNGEIDEVRIWNVARTATQIRENMHLTLDGTESGLVSYYQFNEGSGTTAADVAGGHDGTLINGPTWQTSTAPLPFTSIQDGEWMSAATWQSGQGAPTNPWSRVSIYHDITLGVDRTVFDCRICAGKSLAIANAVTLTISSIITNAGTQSGDGLVKFSGTDSAYELAGVFSNIELDDTDGATLTGYLTVNSTLTLTSGDINLNGWILDLGSTGVLQEGINRVYGTSGTITATRTLDQPVEDNVAGLGALITSAANLGISTITRGHNPQTHGSYPGIARYYDIAPATNTGLDATLVFSYLDEELNGLTESDLRLYRSTDSGNTWTEQGGTIDMNANTITLNGIDAFSRWTAAEFNFVPYTSPNLFANPGAETCDLSGWTILENGGLGWDVASGGYEGYYNFITSYSWDRRCQEFDLLDEGMSALFLDTAPPVYVDEWFRGRPPSNADHYYIKVELRNYAHTAIASWNVGSCSAPVTTSDEWTKQAHTFTGYGPGLRYIYFEDGGKEGMSTSTGYYGARIDAASVTITNFFDTIGVRGNVWPIENGDTTPSLSDHTDFGDVVQTMGFRSRTFTIMNAGVSNLDLTNTPPVIISGPHAADFTVTTQPATMIASGGWSDFTICFVPSHVGVHTATVSIANSVPADDPYEFAIQGTGLDEGTVWFVDGGVASSGDGTTWGTAFKTVEEVVAGGRVGGTILIKYGTYHTSGTITINNSLRITSDDGTHTTWETAAYDRDECTLLCGCRNHRAFMITKSYPTDAVIIRGLCISTFCNGIPYGLDLPFGSAIFAYHAALTVSDCYFQGNKLSERWYAWGGALASLGGTIVVERCLFLFNWTTVPWLPHHHFRARGGALAFNYSEIVVRDNTFWKNGAELLGEDGSNWGGAIYLEGSSSGVIERNIFASNCTQDWLDPGLDDGYINGDAAGAIYCETPYNEVIIDHNVFVENESRYGGAVLWHYYAQSMHDNIFLSNPGSVYNRGVIGTCTNDVPPTFGYAPADHNCFFNEQTDRVSGVGNLLNTDPRLVNPYGWDPIGCPESDFMLLHDSPCIDAGRDAFVYDEAVNHDYGWKEDIGKFEYSGATHKVTITGPGEYLFGGQVRAKLNVTTQGTLSAVEIIVHPGELHPQCAGSVQRWFEVIPTPTTGHGATFDLTLSYKNTELNSNTEGALALARWTGTVWNDSRFPDISSTTENWLTCNGLTECSEWAIVGGFPAVSTANVTDITGTSATCGGNVTDQGDSPVSARGVCWNMTGNPTVADPHTTDDSGTGTFTSSLTGLTLGQTYYVRAYATNLMGACYGEQRLFAAAMSPPGNALDFDGSNDYVAIPNESTFDFTDAMTVEAWIRVDTFTKDWQAIVIKGDNSWRLHRYGNSNNVAFGTNGLNNTDLAGSTSVNDGQWHHVAGVYDGSMKYLYIDGNLDASVSVSGSINNNDFPVYIGENGQSTGRQFYGKIDEVRIWGVARSQSEIQSCMHKILNGNETNLVACYRFDHISGTALYDLTANNNDGTLHNMDDTDWVTSTAPFGEEGTSVHTQTQTNIGDEGKQLQVTITNGENDTNYLGIYRTGDGTGSISSGETFPGGVTQRTDIFWGIYEYGSCTANLVFDYSNISGISDPSAIKLLKRVDAISDWTDVTTQFSHNIGNRTFSGTGFTDFSEYSIGDGGENTLPVTLSSFTAQFLNNVPTLYWTTQSETDNMGWFVYRNIEEDFTTSEKISEFIEGHGTTTQQQSYIYEDNIENLEVGDTLYYWLESIYFSGIVNHYDKVVILTIPDQEDPGGGLIPVPLRYGLYQNYPNPFKHETEIGFALKVGSHVILTIYNLKGQKVITLLNEFVEEDNVVRVNWDCKDERGKALANGIYYYKLQTDKKDYICKMILMK